LGPGPIAAHLDHAGGFGAVVAGLLPAEEPALAGDLGAGGGVPGLPLALQFPAWRWILVEAMVRRAEFLRGAVAELGLADRVDVVEERAEAVGRFPAYRGRLDVVVARGFGPPAVVAECAAPLLRVGGWAVISEPPGGNLQRWPDAGLETLGLVPASSPAAGELAYQVLMQASRCPDRFPRRVGIPAKRPLF
jgi:16S rRNA (guanine527-N7)-methyltransferase